MRRKKKRKPYKILSEDQRKAFAQDFLNGGMLKQLVNTYEISLDNGYKIIKELLEWKLEWKNKEIT